MNARFVSRGAVSAVLAGTLTLLSGCAAEQADPRTTVAETLSPGAQQGLLRLAVSAEQLPPLRRTTDVLSADDVAAQATLPDLAQTLETTGYVGGVKVEYRGDSRRLTGVESQVLAFSSEEGAAEFVDYLTRNAGSFFGDPIKVKPVVIAGRGGWRIDPPLCGCAGAQPLSAGTLRIGTRVIVLQITGPKADPRTVRTLLSTSLDA